MQDDLGIMCPLCKGKVYSQAIHHMVWCTCGNCWIEFNGKKTSLGYLTHPPQLILREVEPVSEEIPIHWLASIP